MLPSAGYLLFLYLLNGPYAGYNLAVGQRSRTFETGEIVGWMALTEVVSLVMWLAWPLLRHITRTGWPFARGHVGNWLLLYGIILGAGLAGGLLRSLAAPLVLHDPLGGARFWALALNLMAACAIYLVGLEYIANRHEARMAGLRARLELTRQLAASRRQVVATDDRLRRELAEFLHGEIQSRLLLAIARLSQASGLAGRDPGGAAICTAEAADHLDRARTSLNERLHWAFDPDPPPASLAGALCTLTERFAEIVPVTLEVPLAPARPPDVEDPRLKHAVLKMIEEALLNAVRHALPHRVVVRLLPAANGGLIVEVRDDGRGFDPAGTPPGLGLTGLGDDLRRLGGEWAVESRPGAGATVTLRVPVAARAGGLEAPA